MFQMMLIDLNQLNVDDETLNDNEVADEFETEESDHGR